MKQTMESTGNTGPQRARLVAVLGMCAALIVVILAAGIIPGAFYVAPAAASVLVGVVRLEYGWKKAVLLFFVSGLLSLILVENKRVVCLFIVLIGYYPILKCRIDTLYPKWLRTVLKLVLCNSIMVFFFRTALGLIRGVFSDNVVHLGAAFVAFAVLGDIAFLLFDYALKKCLLYYEQLDLLRGFVRGKKKL